MAIDPALATYLSKLDAKLDQTTRIMQMILMASGRALPTTSVASVFSGDRIGTTNRYLDLYTNNYPRLVAMKITADFVVPGSAAKLSLQQGDAGLIATLSSTGLTTSDTIWLQPRQSLYINTANTVFSLAGSSFRVLLFDPLAFTVS